MTSSNSKDLTMDERLRLLYPMVNESETPLPRCWSAKDKFSYIGLSQNNLRVQYKGHGKTHKDASSVRATHPIPTSCGIYYFEVKIVSKGRDGYMGVGLSAQGVNMNRLPGWDKNSYGYHGDDGHSFCSSGTGQPYGPTFTTEDVIGCGVNLVRGTCFYTKNGTNLGTAFKDLPHHLYPTVGLQTPGEIVDANFGQNPFEFDIEGELVGERAKIFETIERFPKQQHADWQEQMQQIVQSYLVHHGFTETAQAFSRATDQAVGEDLESMQTRQAIVKLIHAGKMSEAIRLTRRAFPHLFDSRPQLLFTLRVRQFVEMVGGSDVVEMPPDDNWELDDEEDENAAGQGDDGMEDDSARNGSKNGDAANGKRRRQEAAEAATVTASGEAAATEEDGHAVADGAGAATAQGDGGETTPSDDTMEVDAPDAPVASGSGSGSGPLGNVTANPSRFDKLIRFGQHLQSMLTHMENVKSIKDPSSMLMLQDAFSLLAYVDPFSSPVGWQLGQAERERMSNSLNSAILEAKHLPGQPPLEMAIDNTRELLNLMANNELGACAFAQIKDFVS